MNEGRHALTPTAEPGVAAADAAVTALTSPTSRQRAEHVAVLAPTACLRSA